MLHIIGDIHGHRTQLIQLLADAGLMIGDGIWIGGDATLCFVGDYFNRGPDGVGVVDLIMRLQQQAPTQHGRVIALLGNHDIMTLAASHFGKRRIRGTSDSFYGIWHDLGGQPSDLDHLRPDQIMWLEHLPVMIRLNDLLVLHADATFYVEFGETVTDVNATVLDMLRGSYMSDWMELIEMFAQHEAFYTPSDGIGVLRAQGILQRFGGTQIVHGHTPH